MYLQVLSALTLPVLTATLLIFFLSVFSNHAGEVAVGEWAGPDHLYRVQEGERCSAVAHSGNRLWEIGGHFGAACVLSWRRCSYIGEHPR